MTSPMNHDTIVDFFKAKNYYGLPSDKFVFFPQGVLPCLSPPTPSSSPSFPVDYKIMLSTPTQVAFAPDGNGGLYNALKTSSALTHMLNSSIQYLHVFSIDNILVLPADPVFIGFCQSNNADCGNKVLWKGYAEEKIGVMALDSFDRPCVVEYSDMSSADKALVDDNNKLVYGAGNICNHFYTTKFLNEILYGDGSDNSLDDLITFHVANKKLDHYDPTTQSYITNVSSNNCIKLETFIFDIFPLSKALCCGEVVRENEFSPVKNKDFDDITKEEIDSPACARRMMSDMKRRWLIAYSKQLYGEGEKHDALVSNIDKIEFIEVCTKKSYSGEGFSEVALGVVIKAAAEGAQSVYIA